MFSDKKYKFVLNDNFKKQNLPTAVRRTNAIPSLSPDRLRHIIGNYYYEEDGDIAFREIKDFPFHIRIGKTVLYDRGEPTLPLSVKMTPVSLIAKQEVFGPYPGCSECWDKYYQGEDSDGAVVDEIYSYPTLQMKDYLTKEFGVRNNSILRSIVTSSLVQQAVDFIATLQDPARKAQLGAKLLRRVQQLYIRSAAFSISYAAQIGLFNNSLGSTTVGQSEDRIENLLGVPVATKTIPHFLRNGAPPTYDFLFEQFREIFVTVMEDVYYDLAVPVTNLEATEYANRISSTLSAEVDFQFNYESGKYNEYLEENNIPETRIANIYTLTNQNSLTSIILGLREDLDCLEKQIIAFIQDKPLEVLLVTGENLGPLNNFYPFELNFPHYARIKFDKQVAKEFGTSIQEQQLDGFMLRHLSEIPSLDLEAFYKTFRQVQDGSNASLIEESTPNERVRAWSLYEWMIQIDQEINSLREKFVGPLAIPAGSPGFGPMPENTYFFGPTNKSITMAENDVDYYTKLIRFTLFVKKTQEIINEKNRSYTDILNGLKPHQEVIAYRIEKYQNDDFRLSEGDLAQDTIYDKLVELGSPIQSFWFFNSTSEDVVEYVDTQIKFNTQYTYVVKAYKLVVGSRYFYYRPELDLEDIELPEPTSGVLVTDFGSTLISDDFIETGELSREVVSDTSEDRDGKNRLCKSNFIAVAAAQPFIYEIPYFIASGRAANNLPIAPDVQFLPYKSVDDKILINFNSMEGQYRTQFVTILDSDREFYDKLKNERELDPDELLLFEHDDDISAFEAFRLDYHPFGFEDFKESFYRKFETTLPGVSGRFSNSYSLMENLEPNRRYYYIFRTIDSKGQISNPSRIFEVQIVNDGGAIYPYIRNVDFKEKRSKENTKDGRRIISISPTTMQSLIRPTPERLPTYNGLLGGTQLGLKQEAIWGKIYKLRITSSKTGRQVDINIRPKIVHIETPNDDCGNSDPVVDINDALEEVEDSLQDFFEEVSQGFDTEI